MSHPSLGHGARPHAAKVDASQTSTDDPGHALAPEEVLDFIGFRKLHAMDLLCEDLRGSRGLNASMFKF